MKGVVTRLVKEKPFGFIKGEDGNDYFFHSESILNGSIRDVKYGQQVEFDAEEGPKGLRAERVTL